MELVNGAGVYEQHMQKLAHSHNETFLWLKKHVYKVIYVPYYNAIAGFIHTYVFGPSSLWSHLGM